MTRMKERKTQAEPEMKKVVGETDEKRMSITGTKIINYRISSHPQQMAFSSIFNVCSELVMSELT